MSSSSASTFPSLEHEGVLDPLNEIDIFCLQYIFLSRINRSLKEFQESWKMHSLSTKGNMSPCQLFMECINAVQSEYHTLDISQAQSNTPDINQTQSTTFGVNEDDRVQVPGRAFEPCNVLLSQICLIDPLSSSPDFGKGLYNQVLQSVGCHLQSNCLICKVND